MTIVACIEDPVVIKKILAHLSAEAGSQGRGWPAARETPEYEQGRAVCVHAAAKIKVIARDYLAEERCKRRFATHCMAIGPPGKRVYPDYTSTVSRRINANRAFPRPPGGLALFAPPA